MVKLPKNHFKRVISSMLACAMSATILPYFPVNAEETVEKYPYTMFAASDEAGAITVNAGNFCVNGSVATNGTIVSSGNMNINGTRAEQADEKMLYIFDKIDAKYFTGSNVEEYTEDYSLEEMNININNPLEVEGDATLTGNININSALKAFENVELYGEVKNTNNSLIFSKYGDIIIESQNVNLNGLVYAPFGDVVITAQNLNLNNVVIIADSITFECPSVNANYSSSIAEFAGSVSDPLNIPYEEWQYMKDENENDFPDFFEDINNWELLNDTDGDQLPDYVEEYIASNSLAGDTDADGLDDYYEFMIVYTDLNKLDTDENGIDDGQEDLDEDGLINLQEYTLGTNPRVSDSDKDGLTDSIEITIYTTDPMNMDTDNDGINDGDEIYLKTDPLSFNADNKNSFTKTFTSDMYGIECDYFYPEVTITSDSTGIISFEMKAYENNLNYNSFIPGYINMAFDFSIESEFDSALLSFHVSEELFSDDFEPAIYYYNEEQKRLEELENQELNGNVITAELEHFSVYTVLNKKAFDAQYNKANQIYSYMPLEDDEFNENTADADIVFVLDDSGSMVQNDITNGRATATKQFIDQLPETDRVGVVSFNSSATTLYNLNYMTESNKVTLISSLSNLSNYGGTDGTTGLYKAITQLSDDTRAKCVVFLTDGIDNSYTKYNYTDIIEAANEKGITIFTIGLGDNVNDSLLNDIATRTYGKYFSIGDTSELYDCFTEIKELTIDYIVDSNEDGISDYNTWKLCTGQYLNGTGQAVFPFGFPGEDEGEEITSDTDFVIEAKKLYEKVQGNADYDRDGILNGQEVRVISNNSQKYVWLISSPISEDYDLDGYSDYDERNVYNTDPVEYTVMMNKNQIDHLANTEYIASTYKDQVLLEGNGINLFGLALSNLYGQDTFKKIYASEVVSVLENIQVRNEDLQYYEIMRDVETTLSYGRTCLSSAWIQELAKASGDFHADEYLKAQSEFFALEKARRQAMNCSTTTEAKDLISEFRKTQDFKDLTVGIYLESGLESSEHGPVSKFKSELDAWKILDCIVVAFYTVEESTESFYTYRDLYYTSVLFEESMELLEEIKYETVDADLIWAVEKILPIMESEGNSIKAAWSEAIKNGTLELISGVSHTAIGMMGPVGATIEIVLGLGSMTGITEASEYLKRTCCSASMADALSEIWKAEVYGNPMTTNSKGVTYWYAESQMDGNYVNSDFFINYYWYIVNIRNQANDNFMVVQTAGIIPSLSSFTNKTSIEVAETNAEWLTYEYLKNNYLLITKAPYQIEE